MPEGPEVRIMSKFINEQSKNKKFTRLYDVAKGNDAVENSIISNFYITSDFNGKELKLYLTNDTNQVNYSVFMGMSGNWKIVSTSDWNSTKFTRMRLDTECGESLLLFGGYMGPKYALNGFKGTKRGPDPIKNFEEYKSNILNNLDKKTFDNPIYEVLLNQQYFSGVGNYIRSTILYYLDENPFVKARDLIQRRPDIIELSKDVMIKSFNLNGGQLKDWKNPFDSDSNEFKEWVFYMKGKSIKDSDNRTFWFNDKWSI